MYYVLWYLTHGIDLGFEPSEFTFRPCIANEYHILPYTISPTMKNHLIENVSHAKIEKPWIIQILSKLSMEFLYTMKNRFVVLKTELWNVLYILFPF